MSGPRSKARLNDLKNSTYNSAVKLKRYQGGRRVTVLDKIGRFGEWMASTLLPGNRRLFNIARANRGGSVNVGVPEERRERRERRRPGIVRLRYYIQGYPRRVVNSPLVPRRSLACIGSPRPYFKRVSIMHRLTRRRHLIINAVSDEIRQN